MILESILFLVGFVLLIKGSDKFVKCASQIAKDMGVSEFVIGLTLVAVGTSIPELASVIIAALKGQGEIIMGGLIGSNIANLGFIGGIISMIAVVKIKKGVVSREGYIMLFTQLIFYVLIMDLIISRIEGGIFLIIYFIFILFIFETKKDKNENKSFKNFLGFFLGLWIIKAFKPSREKKTKKKTEPKKIGKYIVYLLISSIAIFFGAKLIINGAIFFANQLNLSKNVIGLTIIALGTSLPELGVSISAVKKGLANIAIGNLIGSSIANILFILGIASLITPIKITGFTFYYTAPFMIMVSFLFVYFMRTEKKLRKIEGIILLLLYLAFIISLFFLRSAGIS